VDAIEDFKALRDELKWNLQRSKSREPVSNDVSLVRQLLPRTTVSHTLPQKSVIDRNLHASFNEKPHPYAASAFLTARRRNSTYDQSPSHVNMEFPAPTSVIKRSKKLDTITELSGVSDFVETRTRGMHERSPGWITTYHQPESPTSPLQRFRISLPTTPTINQNIENRRRTIPYITRALQGQPENQLTSLEVASAHPDPNAHDRTLEFMNESSGTFETDQTPTVAPYGHVQSFGQSSFELEPPTPAYFQDSAWRLSDASQTSDISATQAEIVDVPRRMLSFTKYKPSLAKVVLHSVPETKTDMALVGGDFALTDEVNPRHLQKPRPIPLEADRITQPTLSTSHRLFSRSPFPMHQSSISARSSGSQFTQQRAEFSVREFITDEDDIIPFYQDDVGKVDKCIVPGHNVNRIPEALQTIRKSAVKFPGPPSEALIADFHTSLMTPVKEWDPVDPVSEQSHIHEESVASSMRHSKISRDSMDTIEMLRTRIPAELKMKGKATYDYSDIPLPPVPDQEVRQLPPSQPFKRALPSQPLRKLPTPESSLKPALAAKLADSCDSETRLHAMPNDISMLRHPQSFISTMHPVTRRNSGTTATSSFVLPSSHNPNLSSRSSSGAIDSYTASNLKSATGQRTSGTHLMRDLPSMEIMEGYLSVQGHTDLDRQIGLQRTDDVVLSDTENPDDLPERFYQLRRPQIINAIWAPPEMGHDMNLGKPQQFSPQPIRGLQLPPAVIPVSSSDEDVPISAGNWRISENLGVTRTGESSLNRDYLRKSYEDLAYAV